MSAKHQNISVDCDSIRDLIPDYAFGLTDAEQTRLVEANLGDCAEAAKDLVDFQSLQDEMRQAVPQRMPPVSLEDRIVSAALRERPAPSAVPTPIPLPANPEAGLQGGNRSPRRRLWIALAAAAAVVIVLLAASNIYLLARMDDLTRRTAELTTQLSGGQQRAFVLTSTSGLRWVRLPPSQQNADTSAFLMWNAESEVGILYARGFPKLASGTTYQLWLTRGDEKVGVGTFTVDADGKGALLFHSSQPIDKFTWARITAEPVNGSQTPSDQVVVNGKLST